LLIAEGLELKANAKEWALGWAAKVGQEKRTSNRRNAQWVTTLKFQAYGFGVFPENQLIKPFSFLLVLCSDLVSSPFCLR
jgi:hypothetical protein